MSEETVRILVFSDDKDKRAAVINGVGVRASAETKKEGGMSVAQDLQETREDVPPIIFLTARAQDEWLATWAGAAATVSDPIDPIILQETVADVLRGAAR